jgi:hypothetical protein
MRLKILSSAMDDLYQARLFYERQREALGEYFFDSLFSDIDSLMLYAGMHSKFYGYHRLLSKRVPSACPVEPDLPRGIRLRQRSAFHWVPFQGVQLGCQKIKVGHGT